ERMWLLTAPKAAPKIGTCGVIRTSQLAFRIPNNLIGTSHSKEKLLKLRKTAPMPTLTSFPRNTPA
ncbi:MAG: hypothetical protein DMG14_18575, partial [Acidobacteria bacterium]